jgi:hypothetical protein
MLENFKDTLFRRYGDASLYATRHSPELLLFSGLATGIASAIMLAKAHRRSEEEFADLRAGIELEKEVLQETRELQAEYQAGQVIYTEKEDEYTAQSIETAFEENTSRLAEIKTFAPYYWTGAQRAAMLYGPAVITGLASLMLILASHNKLRSRNRALVSALTLVQTSLVEYRRRVAEEYGDEAEHRLYFGLDKRTINTVKVDEKTGKKKKTKSEENVLPEKITPIVYQKIYDQTNQNWSNDPDIRYWTLFQAESMANLQLQMKRWVLLNEVYEWLGMSKTGVGAVVGWSKEIAENGKGDDFISFGLDAPHNLVKDQDTFLLDFNVHGSVIDYIDPESLE